MRRFFVRELARLAPVAVASLFLGLLVYLGLTLLAPASWTHGAADYTYLIVLVGAPWLLGAAAIAPDAENGALTFMATLPVRPWRQLAARLSAAGLYALAVPGLTFLALTPEAAGARHAWLNLQMGPEPLVPFVFAGAALASATIRNALAAFMLAPVFAAVPFWWVLRVGEFWRWPELSIWLFASLPLCLLVGAWAAFARGDHVGRLWSLRSLRLGAAVALAPVLLLSGLSSAVCAYDYAGAWHVEGSYRSANLQRELVFLREQGRLTGRRDLELRDAWCFRAESGELVPLAGRVPASISPDGRHLITVPASWWTHEGEVPVELLDLDAERVEAGSSGSQSSWPRRATFTPRALPELQRPRLPLESVLEPVCWRGQQPYRVTAGGLVSFHGRRLEWPEAIRAEPVRAVPEVLDVAGATVLLRTGDAGSERFWVWGAEALWELPSRPTVHDPDVTWPADCPWGLSPQGRWVLALGPCERDGAGCLSVIEARPGAAWLGPWSLEDHSSDTVVLASTWISLQLSPAEDYLAIQGFDAPYLQVRALFDGGRVDLERGEHDSYYPAAFWTAGGELVLEGEAWYSPHPKGTLIRHDYPASPGEIEALSLIAAGAGPRLIYENGEGSQRAFDLSTGSFEESSSAYAVPRSLR